MPTNHNNIITIMLSISIWILIPIFLLSPTCWSQSSSPSTALYTTKLSSNEKWLSIKEAFPDNQNKTLLKNLETREEIKILPGHTNIFSPDNQWFITATDEKQLQLTSLNTLQQEIIPDVSQFQFSFDGKYIAFIRQENDKVPFIEIRDLETGSSDRYKNVPRFSWNPVKNQIVYVLNDPIYPEVIFYEPSKKRQKHLSSIPIAKVLSLKWNVAGKTVLVMFEKEGENKLLYINEDYIPSILDNPILQKSLSGVEINDREPFISDDGKKILFYTQPEKWKPSGSDDMQVWNTDDPALYPLLKMYENIHSFLLTAWFPAEKKIVEIATKEFPEAVTNINHDFALISNRLTSDHQFIEFPKYDIWLKNIASGDTTLLTENQPSQYFGVGTSPQGKYITYFKDEHWYCYDVLKKKTINLSQNLPTSFINIDNQYPRTETYDWPSWTPDDNEVILSDKYDLWIIKPDGSRYHRMTKGKEKNRSYSINKDELIEEDFFHTVPGGMVTKIKDPNAILLNFKDHDTFESGYGLVGIDKQYETIFQSHLTCSRGYLLSKRQKLIYISENIITPKAIQAFDLAKKQEQTVYQTNPDLLHLNRINYEIIKYKVKNIESKAVLIYPLDYDPNTKYPMISYIYEEQSDMLRRFFPPSDYSVVGFSILNYVIDGYFILLPDFEYTIGDPGISAMGSLDMAINKALENKSIDKYKLGLIGFSFGGYEAAFIATQTNRFAAIVAGGAVTNFVSHYHGVNWNHLNTDTWRYEDQQWRMGKSYYQIKADYLRNSPLEHIENLRTPLLLWTGKEDYQITWTQSLEMFVAMTRLNKVGKLLLFPNESHTLHQNQNQKSLSTEIKSWFRTYLK